MQRRGNILVTGGAGFIGTHLCARLVAAGESVISVDIRPPSRKIPGVSYEIQDVRDLSRFHDVDVARIYNFAAVHTTPGHEDHEYYDTNVPGALEVTRFAVERGVQDIVFTSSISVYGPSEERITEESDTLPTSSYGKSKLMAEKIHQSWFNADPAVRRLLVVRPAVVFGLGEGGNFTRMASLLKRGVFVFPGRRDTIKSCIYVEDLLDLVDAAIATVPKGEQALFNGAYPECPTIGNIVQELRDNHFPAAKLIDVPAGLVRAAVTVLGAVGLKRGGFHPDRVEKLLKSTNVYPGWGVRHGLMERSTLSSGIERWAAASQGTFR